jgi:hypothetical protein
MYSLIRILNLNNKTIVATNRYNNCFFNYFTANNAAKPIPSISAAAISIAV